MPNQRYLSYSQQGHELQVTSQWKTAKRNGSKLQPKEYPKKKKYRKRKAKRTNEVLN